MINKKEKLIIYLISWQKIQPALDFIRRFDKIESSENIEYLILKNKYENIKTKKSILNIERLPKKIRVEHIIDLKKEIKGLKGKGKIIYFDKNYGYTGAANFAIKYCQANSIKFAISSNADIKYEKKIIKSMLIKMQKYNLSVIAPITYERNLKTGNIRFIDDGHIISKLTSTSSKLLNIKKQKIIDQLFKVDWVSGCFFLMDINSLDNTFYNREIFAYTDEIDFMLNLSKKNKIIAIDKSIMVEHIGGGDVNRNNSFRAYLLNRNIILLGFNNFPKYFIISFLINNLRLILFLINPKINLTNKYYGFIGYLDAINLILKKKLKIING